MAASTTYKTVINMFVLTLIVTTILETTEARRGGGGRGGGGRGRSSSSGRGKGSSGGGGYSSTRNYNNVALSGRIMRGSSSYNKNTWRKAAAAGLIFGGAMYLARPRTHRLYNEMPIICTNKTFERDGKRYNNFICPLPDTNDTLKYCCGPESGEYCCDKETAQKYYAEHGSSSGSSPVGMIIGLLVLVIVIAGIVYCCKKSGSGSITKMFRSKREAREPSGMVLNTVNKHESPADPELPSSLVPLNPPANGSYPANAPEYPPPYSANPTAYNSGYGLPYGPPPVGGYAGNPPEQYVPAGVAPYPPPQEPGAPNLYPPPSDGGAVMPPYAPATAPYPAGAPPYPPYPGGDATVAVPPYPGVPLPASAPSYDSHTACTYHLKNVDRFSCRRKTQPIF
ncbi:hypothetical protein EGW08_012421 [Elysia chlorotica]|uniref:CX domain-containing protein n=1 Tax=Elysia chlorotica TaxID=188477 RepID=A0A433TE02_ELYCH|nr:hypothetical protein EGW08_012421 [Elysia chlorotica]